MMIFLKNKEKNKKKGFTLIEMLVAVLIFSISLSALLAISARGLRIAKNAQGDVVGDYLAIEAIEVIRNLRDASLLQNNAQNTWQAMFFGGKEFLEDEGCFSQSGQPLSQACNFFVTPQGQLQLGPCTNCKVILNKNNYYYQRKNDAPPSEGDSISEFSRKIYVKEVSQGQVLVIVEVDWKSGRAVYTENLFLWQ